MIFYTSLATSYGKANFRPKFSWISYDTTIFLYFVKLKSWMCMYNILNYVSDLWIFSEVSNDTIKTAKSVLSLTSLPGRHRGCVSQNCCENLRAIITSSGKNWPQIHIWIFLSVFNIHFQRTQELVIRPPSQILDAGALLCWARYECTYVHMCMSLLTGPYMALHIARSYSFICNKNK